MTPLVVDVEKVEKIFFWRLITLKPFSFLSFQRKSTKNHKKVWNNFRSDIGEKSFWRVIFLNWGGKTNIFSKHDNAFHKKVWTQVIWSFHIFDMFLLCTKCINSNTTWTILDHKTHKKKFPAILDFETVTPNFQNLKTYFFEKFSKNFRTVLRFWRKRVFFLECLGFLASSRLQF